MMPRLKTLLVLLGAFAVVVVAVQAFHLTSWAPATAIQQPIAFDHAVHSQQGMACVDCHRQAEQGVHATFPPLKACMLCHVEPQGEHPDEPLVRDYADRGDAIPWIQVNRLPGHVFFSHRAHVTRAGMDCAECHGDMSVVSAPVGLPQIEHLDMASCVQCHEQRSARSDCIDCHK